MLRFRLRFHRFGWLVTVLFTVIGIFALRAFSATLEEGAALASNVDAERISPDADDNSLEVILARRGEANDIPIRVLVGDTERTPVTFRGLPLEEAMQRLSNRVVYVHDPQIGAIKRIVVLSEGEQQSAGVPDTTTADRLQPFKSELDSLQATDTERIGV